MVSLMLRALASKVLWNPASKAFENSIDRSNNAAHEKYMALARGEDYKTPAEAQREAYAALTDAQVKATYQ